MKLKIRKISFWGLLIFYFILWFEIKSRGSFVRMSADRNTERFSVFFRKYSLVSRSRKESTGLSAHSFMSGRGLKNSGMEVVATMAAHTGMLGRV